MPTNINITYKSIEVILKEIDQDFRAHIYFIPYPDQEDEMVQKISEKSESLSRNRIQDGFSDIFIGQLPKSVSFNSIIAIILKVINYDHELIRKYTYCTTRNLTANTGYISIPEDKTDEVLMYSKRIRTDINGAWIAKNAHGKQILEKLDQSLLIQKETIKRKYHNSFFAYNFPLSSLSIEISEQKEKNRLYDNNRNDDIDNKDRIKTEFVQRLNLYRANKLPPPPLFQPKNQENQINHGYQNSNPHLNDDDDFNPNDDVNNLTCQSWNQSYGNCLPPALYQYNNQTNRGYQNSNPQVNDNDQYYDNYQANNSPNTFTYSYWQQYYGNYYNQNPGYQNNNNCQNTNSQSRNNFKKSFRGPKN